MKKFVFRVAVLPIALLLGMATISLLGAAPAQAAVWTDQQDYSPGSTVTISGDNSDGAGFLPGETVHVDVTGPNGYAASCEGIAANDASAAWSCQVTLPSDDSAVGKYRYTATGQSSGVSQSGTFTDACPDLNAATPISPSLLAFTESASDARSSE